MANDPILQKPYAAEGAAAVQAFNDLVSAAAAASNKCLTVDLASGDVAIPIDQFTGHGQFIASGLTADRDLIVPSIYPASVMPHRVFLVHNTSEHTVTVKRSGGAGVAVAPATTAVLGYDGLIVRGASGTGASGGGGGGGVRPVTLYSAQGPYGASALVAVIVADRAYDVPAGLTGSYAYLEMAPSAEVVFDLSINGGPVVGTLTFAAASTAGTLSSGGFSLAAGDRLRVIAPASPDATAGYLSSVIQVLEV